jgi:peptidylamidoglycolate lyase
MNSNEYLFPNRLTRRDFVKMAGAASVALGLPGLGRAEEPAKPVRFGSGHHTYELVEGWGTLPEGMTYGYGCGVVVDSKDNVYVTSRSANPCVSIFDRDGNLLETWSKEFGEKIGYSPDQIKETAHCLYLSKEGQDEFIYWTENNGGKKDPKLGARIYKTDMRGKVLYTIGNVEKETGTSQKFAWTNPTDVAVAPNGDIYTVDGYGSQKVSRFDKNWQHIKTIGTPGKEHGQFKTCHGIWVNTLKFDPEIYIADRENSRIEIYSMELEYKRTILDGVVRRPCCFYQHNKNLYIPELGSRVSILDHKDEVVAYLGDGRDADGKDVKDADKNPALFARPHALTVDSRGDLYVVEWIPYGRPRKLKHTPQSA